MTRPTKRSLEKQLEDIEQTTENGDDPELFIDLRAASGRWRERRGCGEDVTDAFDNAVFEAVKADCRARRRLGKANSMCIVTEGSVLDYKRRLGDALSEHGLFLDVDECIHALHPCLTADCSFEEVASELDVSPTQLDRVLSQAARLPSPE